MYRCIVIYIGVHRMGYQISAQFDMNISDIGTYRSQISYIGTPLIVTYECVWLNLTLVLYSSYMICTCVCVCAHVYVHSTPFDGSSFCQV